MNKPDTEVEAVRGAVLGGQPVTVFRSSLAPDLEPFVRNAWFVDWDVPAGQVRRQPVLAPPAVNLSVQPHEDAITGVQTTVDERHLSGKSWVWGVLFRPAGFAAFVGPVLHTWVDRRVPVVEVFAPVTPLRERLIRESDVEAQLDALASFLRPFVRDPEPAQREAAEALVQTVREDRSITRVRDLVAVSGASERALQRQLRAWVGLSPGALIRRFRLHEAAHALTSAPDTDLAELAYSLGYADQAHFSRDFARTIGAPPGRYARSVVRGLDAP